MSLFGKRKEHPSDAWAIGSDYRERFNSVLNQKQIIPPGGYLSVHVPSKEIKGFMNQVAVPELKVDPQTPIVDYLNPHHGPNNSARIISYSVPDYPLTAVQLAYSNNDQSVDQPSHAFLIRCSDQNTFDKQTHQTDSK